MTTLDSPNGNSTKLRASLRIARRALPFLALVAVLAAGPLAFAQQFEPFREGMQERTNPTPFLLAAYGSIWVAMVIYVVMVARGLKRAEAELEELRRKVAGGAGGAGGASK